MVPPVVVTEEPELAAASAAETAAGVAVESEEK